MKEHLLTFDIGTSGVKVGLLNPEQKLIDTANREYRSLYPAPQWVEQDIEEMWRAQCHVARDLLKKTGLEARDIAAVAVSSQRATFVPVDEDYQPLMNFIGWQDKRSIAQCEGMKETLGAERYYEIAGLPIDPTAAVSKILWIRDNHPDLFERTKTFASTQNVHLKQLGVEDPPCDYADAAYLGLLDVDRLEWSGELLRELEIPLEKLPHLAPSGEQVGDLSAIAAREMGLVGGIPVVTAGGDLQVAGVGMGITGIGKVSVGIGTGGGVLIFLEQPLRHPNLAMNCLPHAMDGAWEMEGICLASGAAYKWFRDTLAGEEKEKALTAGKDPYQVLNEMAAEVPPGSNGVLVIPSLMGSGSPHWYPKARGAIVGLTLATDKKTLVRAMLEGICLEIRWMLEEARKLGSPIEEVRIWGGAAKSSLWNQIAADIYGTPASLMGIGEAGLVGAAILAGTGIGLFSSVREGVESLVEIAGHYTPDADRVSLYNDKFATFKNTYNALRSAGVFEEIAVQAGQV